MQLEVNNLIKNKTWKLVPRNLVKGPILKGRWVLNKKYNIDGSINKYKARQVVKEFL